MDLDEHVEPELGGERVQVAQLALVERGDDEQHAVGAHQPGVADVEGGDGEVLAQHGQLRAGARRREVGRRPAEELPVGEHREGGRAAVLVGAGQLSGSRSGWSGPFDGDRRLTSAMTASRPSPLAARSAAPKPRAGADAAASSAELTNAGSERGSAAARSRWARRMRSR